MAIAVLYNHSFVLFETAGKRDVVNFVFDYFDAGSIGVAVFFLISGLLITQSFFQSNTNYSFILKRVFRIFPALIVCVFITVFIIGALSNTQEPTSYFTSRNTYRYFYNIFLNNEVFIYNIPGSFETNKLPNVINGSLWTLPFELICYIFLFLFLSIFNYIKLTIPIHVKIIFFLLLYYFTCYLINGKYIIDRVWGLATGFTNNTNLGNNPMRLFLFFFCGIVLYFLRNKIRLGIWMLVITCISFVLSKFIAIKEVVFAMETVSIICFILFVAGEKRLFRFNSKTDPSYGIYLYAWPIQQLTAYFFTVTAYKSILITLPLCLLMGILSYRIIEKPCLVFARKINYASNQLKSNRFF